MISFNSLILNKTKFDSLKQGFLYETEFEKLVSEHLNVILEDVYVVDFKKTVSSENGNAQPDFAIICKNYKQWWVVEVELSHHSFSGHVWPQVNILNNAYYGQEEADYLFSKNSNLNREKLIEMMKGDAPDIVVIADIIPEKWIPTLQVNEIFFLNFKPFISKLNSFAFEVSGVFPRISNDVLTMIYKENKFAHLLDAWIVSSPSGLAEYERKVSILIEGQITNWTKVQTQDQTWLMPVHDLKLTNSKYKLILNDNNQIELKKVE